MIRSTAIFGLRDIVQYTDDSGMTYHSQIVHDYFKDAAGKPIMWVAQHSTDSNYWGGKLPLLDEIKSRKGHGWFVTLKMKLATQ